MPQALSPAELAENAADKLATLTAQGGAGYSFTVIQRNRLRAKDLGPRINITDPADQTQVIAVVDERLVNSMVSTGVVRPDGFFMEMRLGSGDSEAVDLSTKPIFTALADKMGTIWRKDGAGWYQTDVSPGMGFDPDSARLLPTLLRRLAGPTDLGARTIEGVSLAAFRGRGTTEDYPGVVASDGKDFTEPAFDITLYLDDRGRLARLEAVAQNLNQKTFNLFSETVVNFGYASVPTLPSPVPTMAPEPPPSADPADQHVAP